MQSSQNEIENLMTGTNTVRVQAKAARPSPAKSVKSRSVLPFGYLFPDLQPFRPASDDGLVKLGRAMIAGPDLGEHPNLPAGYTYLAQFIAHDVSFDKTKDIPKTPIQAGHVEQGRTRALDLESLYGVGTPEQNKHLYESDLTHLVVGSTSLVVEGSVSRSYHNDLPRNHKNPQNPREALIGDPRNDENLALAQIHLAFLRFHNKVVDVLSQDSSTDDGSTLFERARKKVVQHFQWIILHDFLPKVVEESVLREAINVGSRKNKWKKLFVPIEFSLAAFRLGHSMLRDTYEWNRFKQSPHRSERLRMAELFDLFRFTGLHGNMGGGGLVLPTEWIIDWTRFFDFTGYNGVVNNPKSNRARRIDNTLAPSLKGFQNFLGHISNPDFRSLPVVDLVRGSRLGLPAGQAVAEKLGLTPLSPAELLVGPHRDILKAAEFHKKTPLWYYILKEADAYHSGTRLGPVGSHILSETFVELIRASRNSIFEKPAWKPDLGQKERDQMGMTDLLVLAEAVNPLGS